MQLLTQILPSGKKYSFDYITINPMKFGQLLEYMENCPDEKKNPVEKYYFDYCVLKADDPNIDHLLLVDYEYCLYMKKGITISNNLTFESSIKCPRCGNLLQYRISLSEVKWNSMDKELLNGITIDFSNQKLNVRMPSVLEFLNIFKKYRTYKRVTDIRIIKLISLFEDSIVYTQKIEDWVTNATYKDISTLFMLDGLFYNFIKPKVLTCPTCVELYNPTEHEIYETKMRLGLDLDQELSEELIRDIKVKQGGVEIGLDAMVSNFFRDINLNNRPSSEEIIFRKVQ